MKLKLTKEQLEKIKIKANKLKISSNKLIQYLIDLYL